MRIPACVRFLLGISDNMVCSSSCFLIFYLRARLGAFLRTRESLILDTRSGTLCGSQLSSHFLSSAFILLHCKPALFLCGILLTSALSQLRKDRKMLKDWLHWNVKNKNKTVEALSDVLLHARCLPMDISKWKPCPWSRHGSIALSVIKSSMWDNRVEYS